MPTSKSVAPVASDTAANDTRKRRKNVGTACLACKARKLKCTGAPPCANCVKSRLECNLDETADRRRRGALKRKVDELEDKQDLLVRLVDVIRESSNRRTISLLNLIRSNASLSEIRFYIENQLPQSELTKTPELLDVTREVQQREASEPQSKGRVLGPRRHSDAPRFSVPARPWTSVTADDDLVSRLISLWFTWIHPFCNWIDRDLFFRDMKAGSLSASYCSPFLVNIILADACAYSDYSGRYGLPDDLVSQRTNFYEEAKRLLDKEEGRISLPTVQGLGVLWMCACNTGRDRQGWISRGRLAYSLQELSQAFPNQLSTPDPDTTRMAEVVRHTNWGLFNLDMIHALFVRKPPVVKPPSQSSFSVVSNQCDQVDAHTSCLFNALCNLNRIAYHLGPFLYSHQAGLQSHLEIENEMVEALRDLIGWPDCLPDCLKESGMDVPHVLSLHMYYHNIITAIYGVLKSRLISTKNSVAWSSQILDTIISPVHAQEICVSSARKIAQLALVHRSNWGFDRMPGATIHCIMAALFTLLDVLDDPANRDAFTSLTVAASAFSRRSEYTKGLLRTLQTTARQRGIALPAEAGSLFVNLD